MGRQVRLDAAPVGQFDRGERERVVVEDDAAAPPSPIVAFVGREGKVERLVQLDRDVSDDLDADCPPVAPGGKVNMPAVAT